MKKTFFCGVVAILSTMDFPLIWADENDHIRARELLRQGTIRPLEEIVAQATKKQPGRLLEAELKMTKGKVIYEIEILDHEGVVWELRFDAESGTPLDSHREN